MIIKKEILLEVEAGVSTTGDSGRYMKVDISEDSENISEILDDIGIWLSNEFTSNAIKELIASEDGLHIRINANLVD